MKVRRIDFSPDEWLVGCGRLSLAERGLYITACALMYSHGGPIAADDLRAACQDHGHTFKAALQRLIALGKLQECDGSFTNKRVSNELQNAFKRASNARQNVAKRWKNNGLDREMVLPRGNANHQPSKEEYSDTNVSGLGKPTPADPVKEIYDRGLAILGGNARRQRGLLGKMRRDYGDTAVLAAIIDCEATAPSEPASYLIACCERRKRHGAGDAQSGLTKLAEWARAEDERQGLRGDHEAAD